MKSQFAILRPCSKNWAELQGNGQKRYCETCRTDVHAIEKYSPEEWTRIWNESGGHVCGYLEGESPEPPRSRRAVLVGALLTAISPLMAQNGRVRIRVTDRAGAPVPSAKVALLDSNGFVLRTLEANDSGEIVWTGLPMGDNQFELEVPFNARRLTATLHNGDEKVIETVVNLGIMGEVVRVTVSVPPAASEDPQLRPTPDLPLPLSHRPPLRTR